MARSLPQQCTDRVSAVHQAVPSSHSSESANGMGMQVPPPVTSIYTPNGQLLATEVAGRLRVGEGASGCAGHSVVRTTTPLVRHIHFVANAGVSPSHQDHHAFMTL